MNAPQPASKTKGALSEADLLLADKLANEYFDDPLGYVLWAFAWGYGPLKDDSGPDQWQIEILAAIRDEIQKRGASDEEALHTAIQIAVASGHGIGKTALVAWIILWFMSTRPFPQLVVTANTKAQLTTKTWRELAKWHKLSLNAHWFEWSATALKHVVFPETWFASAIPWSEHNSEAFAGTHEKHVLVIFDEASAVADTIWEVTEGAMTTKGAIWLAFGNPTKNTGRFAECFGKFKHRWTTKQVDSRTAKMANKAQIQQWIDDYGEDHDFVRVRVRGVFPRAGSMQFIGGELVLAARKRRAEGYEEAAIVLGVDVARHGDDQSVIARRQGAKWFKAKRFRLDDLMALATVIANEIDEHDPDAVFLDATGIGWGVVDRLRQMGYGKKVIAIQTGERAMDEARYFNRRAEVWGRMKEGLIDGADIPEDDVELEAELTSVEYGFDTKTRIQLEKKEDMKSRGHASPDVADAYALTYASPVAGRVRTKPSWRDKLRKHQGASGRRNPMAA